MKRSVDLDEDLASEVDKTSSLIHEKPATVIRLAIRAGLPVVANRFQARARKAISQKITRCPKTGSRWKPPCPRREQARTDENPPVGGVEDEACRI